MNLYSQVIVLCFLVNAMLEPSRSVGIFEVHLSRINFTRWRGPQSCCSHPAASPLSCALACSVYARICLTVFNGEITKVNTCVHGNYSFQLSPPLRNSVSLTKVDRDFRFFVPSRWNGFFSLVFDVFGGQRDEKLILDKNSLLMRHVDKRSINPSKDWYTFMREDSGVTIQYSYRFHCDTNYYGKDCARQCKPRNGTHGHYDCSETGERVCHPGWSGLFCNIEKCDENCHMICETPGVKCRCEEGWEGPQCNICKKAENCVNGVCKIDKATKIGIPGTCECKKDWGGQNCETDLHYCANHKGVCQNGGTCLNKPDLKSGGNQQFSCRCKNGFVGPVCQTNVRKSCLSKACNGRGRCMHDAETKEYICICSAGYFGEMCELNATECSEKLCGNITGTHCAWDINDTNLTLIRCLCPPGKQCGKKSDYCASRPCENGGTCLSLDNGYRCSCPPGMSGNRCQFNLSACGLTCRHGGRCRHTATRLFCDCPIGFTGATCECPPCYHGSCVRTPGPEVGGALEYRCICDNGYYGPACNRSRLTAPTLFPTQQPGISPLHPSLTVVMVVGVVLLLSVIIAFIYCCRRLYRFRRRSSQANDFIKNNRPSTIQNDLHAPMTLRPDSPMPSATVHPQTAALTDVKKPLEDRLELPPPKVNNIADQSVNLLSAQSPTLQVALPNGGSGINGGVGANGGNGLVWPISHSMPGAKDTAVFLSSPERRRQGVNWFPTVPSGHATQV